jgi:predicted small secreted protein
MKKLTAMILAVILVFSLTACGTVKDLVDAGQNLKDADAASAVGSGPNAGQAPSSNAPGAQNPPASAAPASPAAPAPAQPQAPVNPYASLQAGEAVYFGGYYWMVLEVKDGKALILSSEILTKLPYHPERNVDITWEKCDLRATLNGPFFNSFSAEDRARIVETKIVNNDNPRYGTPGGRDTNDKIF